MEYEITIEEFEMEGKKYIGHFHHEDFAGIVVQGNDIPEILRELAISVEVLYKHKKSNP